MSTREKHQVLGLDFYRWSYTRVSAHAQTENNQLRFTMVAEVKEGTSEEIRIAYISIHL
jgi:hypothetical protein